MFERIPWEALERQAPDRQWLMVAGAGALVLGALAYSFFREPQVGIADGPAAVAVEAVSEAPPTAPPPPPAAVPAAPSPPVATEAELGAVAPATELTAVAGIAELFATAYFTAEGGEGSQAELFPGLTLPEVAGPQVFVDWAGAVAVEETSPGSYRVVVAVRSMSSAGDGDFSRVPTRAISVPVSVEEGVARVAGMPSQVPPPDVTVEVSLSEPPAELSAGHADGAAVLGGLLIADGEWALVILDDSVDGVARPVAVEP